jgi:hypothetical protein
MQLRQHMRVNPTSGTSSSASYCDRYLRIWPDPPVGRGIFMVDWIDVLFGSLRRGISLTS